MAFKVVRGGDGGIDLPDLPQIPQGSAGKLLWVVLALLILGLAFSSFYQVEPEEIAIVLRLGKYRGAENNAGPGLHFKIPLVDQVVKVPVERQLKAEFGFRTERVAVQSSFSSAPIEASMLTGDLNAANVEWVVQYRIVDPYQYVFRVRNVEATFRDMSEAVMRKIVGDRTVNEVLTVGRAEIEDQVKLGLQELCEQYETGIRVDQVVLQTINPPDEVKASFNEVNQAEQELERLVNEAQQQYNRVIPQAEGVARQSVQQAEGYKLDRVNRAQGEAARFNALYAEYRKAPDITRKRLYLETMNQILSTAGQKVVVDESIEGLVPMLGVESGSAARARQAVAAQQAQGGN